MVLLIRKTATASSTPMITTERAPMILPTLVKPATAALE